MLLLVPLVALNALISRAQATVKLPYGAALVMRQAPFRAAGHKLGYRRPAEQNTAGALETIDGQPFFGADGEVPRSQLVSANLLLNGVRYHLPVSRMYNPWPVGYEPQPRLFRLTRQPQGYLLWAMFSDGAGGYTVQWRIAGGKAKRIKLSADERYFF